MLCVFRVHKDIVDPGVITPVLTSSRRHNFDVKYLEKKLSGFDFY